MIEKKTESADMFNGNQVDGERIISIVVPVFNENEGIDKFYGRVRDVVDSLKTLSYEIVFVDDGSNDGSYQKLIRLANSDSNIRVIKFSRNFGHQIAITAGIDMAAGDAVVVIDADLQDPPEIIIEFVKKWEEGYDVVYGIREKRKGESIMKLLSAGIFYRLLKLIIKFDIPLDAGDFRLMSKRAVEQFKSLREKDRFVRGLTSWIGFKQTGVYYSREKRFVGETKYSYSQMIKFAFDGITSFSNMPLKLATWLGYCTSFLAFMYMASVFVQKVLGYTVQGWATIMAGILFLGGIQLICLGIIGEYIGRIFNEVKQRPLYVIEEIYRSDSTGTRK
ncbi:ribonuclease III [Candidatus Scalindua japonica]|uniref:Ribonuclease III n=1 Tax=Candidatus Scalindua japonica TaxID=1284222 RepID=A0A286TX23_9BACT|nr:glycosyltransferase family 2 protein [Candidatus Scalindua japonica]GAX60433.1 ribonuclease III [Candidatus Scalindua japonica]